MSNAGMRCFLHGNLQGDWNTRLGKSCPATRCLLYTGDFEVTVKKRLVELQKFHLTICIWQTDYSQELTIPVRSRSACELGDH